MQTTFKFEEDQLMAEVSRWEHSQIEKGQIYTRPEVVEFMLTALGLHNLKSLQNIRILEPSCGEGEFVIGIAKRLINHSSTKPTIDKLLGKVLAVDLVGSSIETAKTKLAKLLTDHGYLLEEIRLLLADWFLRTDFLIEDITANFTHIIGNPPYVRVESIPKKLLDEYRKRYSTMTDRADLYIAFYEKSLSLLLNGGSLSFICTDRWTKNTYGKSLRQFISSNYSLELFIDLYGYDAFDGDVMTYPAITQIKKFKGNQTIYTNKVSFTNETAINLLTKRSSQNSDIQIRKGIVNGSKPWLLGSTDQVTIINKLEQQYPTLEEAGCKVYIGAATGSNSIFIVDQNKVEIEKSRLVPVITANELKKGNIEWAGKYLINTYDENGVINLEDFPLLAKYLNRYKDELCKRHIAQKDKQKWYKTIDRVYENRVKKEKLLIPDISNEASVIYDKGNYHPNNSIYYICSQDWNLHALKVVLLSNVTKIFITMYSTKIANGYFRFQAQHLRKLRLPYWGNIDDNLKAMLVKAGESNEISKFTELTCKLYGLNKKEISIIGG